ncbi:MAG TPA: hypothetical protein VM344_02815 [Vitreimonas sp.]|nr:hypothetical protein [Vitreimonas sp.]
MIRSARGRLLAVPLAILVLATGGPATAHSPDPLIGWPAWNQDQVVRYRWMAGEVPPSRMQTAIKAGAADSNATKGSRAATFVYDAAGTSTVEYGVDVFCGVNGLACADGSKAPKTFRVAFRPHGHRFDWGQLRWCQMLDEIANGCFDVENITLDELGHVLGLGHHANYADESDYGDSVVQTVSRARPKTFWDAHAYGRCDVATLQTRYDMTNWGALYSTCLDLAVTLTLSASATSIRAGTTITFTANLRVADNPGDGRLTDNPISGRVVYLQRRPVGATTWTSMGQMAAGSTAGTYTLNQSPTATYEWRAVFPKPGNEGLRARNSTVVKVSVSSCTSSPCPQSAPASMSTSEDDREVAP